MCPSRRAIVVTGAGVGTGSGDAESIVHSPEPAGIGAADVPRRRMLQQPCTGSQKYSSSARPCSRGRKVLVPVPVQLVRESLTSCHFRTRLPPESSMSIPSERHARASDLQCSKTAKTHCCVSCMRRRPWRVA